MIENKQERSRNSGAGHETTDIRMDRVIPAVGGLVALLVFSALGVWFLFKVLLAATPVLPPAPPPRTVASPEPRLQVSPARDLAALRAEEDRILHSAGWIDREAGIARIPIEQAMALLAKRSKPSGAAHP